MKMFLLPLAFSFVVVSSPNVNANNFDRSYYNQEPYKKKKVASRECASCECPSGKPECTYYKAKCECVDGTLYYKGSSWCAQYEEDCDRPDWHKHFAHHSGCLLCDCDKSSCNVGALCHCNDGVVYKGSGMGCVRIRQDCYLKHRRKSQFRHKRFSSRSGCLRCDCNKPSCNVGGLCHCKDGVVYLKEDDMECVRYREECYL
ncbi:uncharacterized protein LOC125945719 [Dermacentor silvarum]|uniref:uncharacterized protein LOC125945719 n=1 Tax=Dermacentor silvarum TaxID=543639 RepID=UPI002100D9D0|nr:uncharacterized protein LOC125945719 [Dermacentor silvarum]